MNIKQVIVDSTIGVALLLALLAVVLFDTLRGTPAGSGSDEVVSNLLNQPRLNKFGNPEGKGYGLAEPGEFQGARLLVWSPEIEVQQNIFTIDNPLWAALKAEGFLVRQEQGQFQPEWLKDTDQLWIFAGRTAGLTAEGESAVVSFVDAGNGLYLLADNEPYLADARQLVRRLFDTTIAGDFAGANLIAVRGHGVTRDDYRLAGSPEGSGAKAEETQALLAVINRATHYAEEHPLLTDVNFIYEGMTISHIEPTPRLQTVLKASDGQILAAVSRNPRQRVVVDCGWTRYYYSAGSRFVTETAGTLRYAENIAAYLMGKERKGLAATKRRRR